MCTPSYFNIQAATKRLAVWFFTARKTLFLRAVLFSVAFVCCWFFVLHNHIFFTRNIQYTSTKLSGIICRLPQQIKFEYYNSNSLLWLDLSNFIFLERYIPVLSPTNSKRIWREFIYFSSEQTFKVNRCLGDNTRNILSDGQSARILFSHRNF